MFGDDGKKAEAEIQKQMEASRAAESLKLVKVFVKDGVANFVGSVPTAQHVKLLEGFATNLDGVKSSDVRGVAIIPVAAPAAPAPSTAAPAPSPPQAQEKTYTVVKGDTLSAIAKRFYGDSGKEAYMRIARANNIANPDRIEIGQVLKIPAHGGGNA